MRFPFRALPAASGGELTPRPVVDIALEGLLAAPMECLLDAGALRTRMTAQAGQVPYGLQADMIPWWQTVAASRALQARARELADQLSAELAQAMAATGTAEAELAAALAVAAYRTVQLQAIRCILAGEDTATVAARHAGRICSAFSAVDRMMSEGCGSFPSERVGHAASVYWPCAVPG
jgi:hypothetical protein